MIRQETPAHRFEEWTYHEDQAGIVYCLGRSAATGFHEAIAAYIQAPAAEATKWSIDSDNTYRRLMYHGFDEEDEKLTTLPVDSARTLTGQMSAQDSCLYVDPSRLTSKNPNYQTLKFWLECGHPDSTAFCDSLGRARDALSLGLIPTDALSLYGGVAYGLLGDPSKRVDDIDLLVSGTSRMIFEQVQELLTPYEWADINPFNNLSKRRQQLKAKRWSTSQIRLNDPDFLSIDFKMVRPADQPSLWEDLPTDTPGRSYRGALQVVDDSEVFCISPAMRCEDEHGVLRTVLARGYPYIGCAVIGDVIEVQGTAYEDSSCIVVTQSERDNIVPDFRNVPIS